MEKYEYYESGSLWVIVFLIIASTFVIILTEQLAFYILIPIVVIIAIVQYYQSKYIGPALLIEKGKLIRRNIFYKEIVYDLTVYSEFSLLEDSKIETQIIGIKTVEGVTNRDVIIKRKYGISNEKMLDLIIQHSNCNS